MNHHTREYYKISPSKARELIYTNPYILLIDVRDPEEYYEEHIPGSINIPLQVLDTEIVNLSVNPSTPIILYCKMGMRAASGASLLYQMGFQNLYVFGGIDDWKYETVRYGDF